MQDALLGADGGAHGRDPNAERDADHYGPGTGGKKRKVPAFTQTLGRQDEEPSGSESDDGNQPTERQKSFPVSYRSPRSKAATACSFRKALFLRRKAALITLYIDAQNAISNGATQTGFKGPTGIMDVPSFEKLMPALEDIGVCDWPPDRPTWRSRWEDSPTPKSKTLEQWRTGFAQRSKIKSARRPTVRGGWAPEGTFEFEMISKASIAMRNKIRDQAALHKLVNDLRSITLSAKPPPKPVQVGSSLEKPPQKTQRTSTRNPESLATKASPSLTRTPSKDSEPPSSKGKSKKKKKKRSVMANQGNPHHVDNYRPSRRTAVFTDPYEPYPHHSSLLFPPPMRLLSLGPQRRTAPLPGSHVSSGPVRAAEDDFICCFCEMDLFFGTEAARKRAIRRLKQERRRKEAIRNKAKDVAEGKGKLKDEESDYDDDEEEWCGEDDGHGGCTCGRQLSEPHRSVKSRLKPPDTDPPHEYDHHDHHHELENDYDHHHEQRHVFDHVALHTNDGTILEGMGFVQEDLD